MEIYTETLPSGFSFDMLPVEGGTFRMGGSDPEAQSDEEPAHEVTVTAFYLGKFPVTQALWKAVMGEENNPSFFKGDNRPVERVSRDDALKFIQELNNLSLKSRLSRGLGLYRLPSEAEWEFSARGGNFSEGYLYAGSDKLMEVGWYDKNSNSQTQDVGLLMVNELGFFDLSGNVREWLDDRWHDNYHGAPIDGSAWLSRNNRAPRVVKGGCYEDYIRYCRVSFRTQFAPSYRSSSIGFRLALSLG